MQFLRKNILIFIFLALIYGAFFVFHALAQKPASLNVLGADTNTTLFVEPSAGRGPILSTIDNAREEILVDNKKAYVGSVNLSSQSMDQNRELGIIIS